LEFGEYLEFEISPLGWLQHDACKVILWQHIKVIALHLRKEHYILGVFTLQSFHCCQCPSLVDHVAYVWELRDGVHRWNIYKDAYELYSVCFICHKW